VQDAQRQCQFLYCASLQRTSKLRSQLPMLCLGWSGYLEVGIGARLTRKN